MPMKLWLSAAGFFLREREHPAGSVSEAFEHASDRTVQFPTQRCGGVAPPHLPPSAQRGARGMPNPTMATMSRWISFVPPPNVKMV